MAVSPSRRPPIPGSIGLLFGGLWSYLGAESLPHPARLAVALAGAVITLALIVALWRQDEPEGSNPPFFRRQAYIIAVVLEFAAIFAASTILPQHGLKAYLVPTVGVIVGLHFIGLWQATRSSVFLWIAGCMCSVSAASAMLPEAVGDTQLRNAVAGAGNALVLWIFAGRR